MSDAPNIPSLNGTHEEVQAFFRRDRRTIERWVATGKLRCFRMGADGDPIFGSQHIVDCWVNNSVEGLQREEAKARALSEWGRHLALVRADRLMPLIEELQARVADIERINGMVPKEFAA